MLGKKFENPQNQCFVSIASLWEMSIKIGLGKLDIQSPFETVLDDVSENGFELLPVTFEHTFQNSRLDWYHKDPFDRLLVAQCLVEKISIISRDSILDLYFGNALVKANLVNIGRNDSDGKIELPVIKKFTSLPHLRHPRS